MKLGFIREIEQQNPWFEEKNQSVMRTPNYRGRLQLNTLMLPEWDNLWTLLIGPRRAGKTTSWQIFMSTAFKSGKV